MELDEQELAEFQSDQTQEYNEGNTADAYGCGLWVERVGRHMYWPGILNS